MRLIFLICFLALFFGANGQPVVNRAGQANTVQDARLSALYNFFLPKYADTAAANLNIGIDSLGAKIFTYDIYGEWTRTKNQNGTKYWSLTSGGGNAPGGGGNWIVSGTGQTVLNSLTGAGIGTANAYPMWFITNGQIRIQLPASGLTLSNDTTSNKVFTFNPSTKDWGYANWVGGGGGGGGITGSGAANRVTWWDGTSSVTSTSGFTFDGTNILSIPSTGKYRIGADQALYMPDQTNFTGSFFGGRNAGSSLTHTSGLDGQYNTGFGWDNSVNTTTGYLNAAFGVQALKANTTGYYNTGIGGNALFANTTGVQNTALGAGALQSNTTGSYNVAVGSGTLTANTTGQTNVGVGDNAMLANTTGLQNVAVGYRSLQSNTIGYYNTFLGYRSGEGYTGGIGNIGIGNHALSVDVTGRYNTAIGTSAGNYHSVSDSANGYNVYLGYNSGVNEVTGKRNTFLGSNTTGTSALNDAILIGQGATATANNQFVVSDSARRFTFSGISRGVANYVLTDSLGNGQYWVARPNAALSLGLQDVITNDAVLTSANTINLGAFQLNFGQSGQRQQIFDPVNKYWALGDWAGDFGNATSIHMVDSIGTVRVDGDLQVQGLRSFNSASQMIPVYWNQSTQYFTDGKVVDSVWREAGKDSIIFRVQGIIAGGTRMAIKDSVGGGSGLTVGTTTVTSGTSRAILYSNTGVLKDSSIFVFNTGGELQVGSSTDAGNFRLQVTGKSNFSDTLFTTHGRFAGMDVGVYGGGMGFQNDAALTGKSGLYFRTFSGGSTNGPIVFESGSFKAQMIVSDATQNQMQVVYGGNTGYFNVGSHTNIYSSSGQELRLGSGGNLNKLTINTTGYVGANVTSPTSALHTTSFATGYASKSADYTLTASDHTIEVTATGTTQTLPTAASITGRIYTIKLTASGTGTVATTSSQTIDGSTTYSLSAQYKYVTVQSNGSNWIIIANN